MVNSSDAIARIHQVQNIFNYLSLLHLDDYEWPKSACITEKSKPHDFIIVGAGTAGCVIANRLIERGNFSVLLIEAGGDPPKQAEMPGSYLYLKRSKYDWNFTSTVDLSHMSTHRNGADQMTQGKMLGGTGSLDYMGYERGNQHDYNRWAKLTNDSTWSWDSVQAAFYKNEMLTDKKILNSSSKCYYGTQGRIKIMKEYFERNQKYFAAFRELGWKTPLDINPDTPLGFTDVMYHIGDGERQSTARKFLSPIKTNPNLHVMKYTLATKIIFDKHKRAIGVEVLTQFNKKFIVKANIEVIVSAGVFKSPQLLLLSGIGPKDHLKEKGIDIISDLPVGYNFQDHVNVVLVYKLTNSKKATVIKNPNKYPFTIFDGYVAMNSSNTYPDYQAVGISLAEKEIFLEFCASFFNFKASYCDRLVKHIDKSELFFVLITNLYPKSRGRVYLASTDPKDYPIIVPGYFSNYDDVINHANYNEDFNRILKTTYFKSVKAELMLPKLKKCEEFKEGSKESWRCLTVGMSDTSYYYVGTCGMGSVLDSRLRVLGVKNLRVIDSSSFTDTLGSTTLATVVMLAQKGVEFIIEDNYRIKN